MKVNFNDALVVLQAHHESIDNETIKNDEWFPPKETYESLVIDDERIHLITGIPYEIRRKVSKYNAKTLKYKFLYDMLKPHMRKWHNVNNGTLRLSFHFVGEYDINVTVFAGNGSSCFLPKINKGTIEIELERFINDEAKFDKCINVNIYDDNDVLCFATSFRPSKRFKIDIG